MFKKIDYPYIIFLLFIIFIFYSYYFILESNKHTKNNYLTLEKIEKLNLINKRFDNTLSQKLKYLDKKNIEKNINTFEKELSYLKIIIFKDVNKEQIEPYFQNLKTNFEKKNRLLKDVEKHNYKLVSSLQKLLDIQVYIQKRYYFSPIGLEVNAIIVNFTQSALGKKKKVLDIEQNIKRLVDLKNLYKLGDKQLLLFIDNSYLALNHLHDLKDVTTLIDKITLENSIIGLKNFLVSYYKKSYEKEQLFSYILIFVISCFVLTLAITYEIDKKHKKELLTQTSKLNEAQACAHLGSWEIDIVNKRIYFSEEMYNICEIDHKNKKIGLKEFLYLIHPIDRNIIKKEIKLSQIKHEDGAQNHKILTKKNRLKYVKNIWHNEYDENGKL